MENTGLYILGGVVVVLVIYLIKIYNNLVSYRTQYENGFEQISVQMKRRLDLIPNLVATASQYMKHEKETLENVTRARQNMLNATNAADKMPGDKSAIGLMATAEGALIDAMNGFNLKVEAYPDLKASANMMQLTEELVATENRVSYARQAYNDLVQKFNEYRRSFPPVVFAGMFGFKDDAEPLKYAESVEELSVAPKVEF